MKNFIEVSVLGAKNQIVPYLINLRNVHTISNEGDKTVIFFNQVTLPYIETTTSYEEIKKLINESL